MLDALASAMSTFLRETMPSFLRQTIPSIVATLAAAGLIAGYNHTFHLQQPRMAALHNAAGGDQAPAPAATTTVSMTKRPTGPVTEYITIHEVVDEPDRRAEKNLKGDLGKDQTAAKDTAKDQPVTKAAAPVPAPRPLAVAPKTEPRIVERRPEPRVAAVPPAQPAVVAVPQSPVFVAQPQPIVAPPPPVAVAPLGSPVVVQGPVMGPPAVSQELPPVVASRPYVVVPDRSYQQRPAYEANAENLPPPPPPQGAFGVIVNTLSPAALFARARQFGEKIEQAGNDILPNIRQQ